MTLFWAALFGFGLGYAGNRYVRKGEGFDLLCVILMIFNLVWLLIENSGVH